MISASSGCNPLPANATSVQVVEERVDGIKCQYSFGVRLCTRPNAQLFIKGWLGSISNGGGNVSTRHQGKVTS